MTQTVRLVLEHEEDLQQFYPDTFPEEVQTVIIGLLIGRSRLVMPNIHSHGRKDITRVKRRIATSTLHLVLDRQGENDLLPELPQLPHYPRMTRKRVMEITERDMKNPLGRPSMGPVSQDPSQEHHSPSQKAPGGHLLLSIHRRSTHIQYDEKVVLVYYLPRHPSETCRSRSKNRLSQVEDVLRSIPPVPLLRLGIVGEDQRSLDIDENRVGSSMLLYPRSIVRPRSRMRRISGWACLIFCHPHLCLTRIMLYSKCLLLPFSMPMPLSSKLR